MKIFPFVAAAVLAAGPGCTLAAAQEGAQREITYGEAEYFNSCAVCHGLEGRGDGILATELKTPPADLTLLSSRNGGAFPYWLVYSVIDGRHIVPGHGERDMPVWGRHFIEDDAARFGPREGEMVTSERIHELASYIETLQR